MSRRESTVTVTGSLRVLRYWCPNEQFPDGYWPMLYDGAKQVTGKDDVEDIDLRQEAYKVVFTAAAKLGERSPSVQREEPPTTALNLLPPLYPHLNSRAISKPHSTHICAPFYRIVSSTIISDTQLNIERQFSLTTCEHEQDLLEQSKPQPPPTSSTNAEGGEEEEEQMYNPLELAAWLGWKALPYWPYKLRGPGVEYQPQFRSRRWEDGIDDKVRELFPQDYDILTFLDRCKDEYGPKSVLYVSFGMLFVLSE
ncbi:hypothetical protein FISHEDRAFT_74373 [Fistulina hepatica ATCC 64428]|uniref:Uncharacterized protein n=1 Tax=Fistulina hepatica ATCC 64428 TaxID=1128425 RepID=A0A0D7ABB3_9AGAR|nr:hypothetical protein FISHEDRAFT_74373 [Fistulina hepatica ATCC 64428]